MRAKNITVTEAAREFSDYLNRVAYRRESFILCKGRKPMAELRPVPQGRRLGDLPELLAALPQLTRREAESFAEDLRRARESLPPEELKNPWAS